MTLAISTPALWPHQAHPMAFGGLHLATPSTNSRPNNHKKTILSRSTPISHQASTAPWEITDYFTKKKRRRTDTLGNIIDTPEDTAESFAWTPEARLRLAAISLATELHTQPEILLENVVELAAILPGGTDTIDKLRAADAIRLAAAIHQVPARLIALREALPPRVDAAALIMRWPEAALLSTEQVTEGVSALRNVFEEELGEHVIDAMLQITPQLLDKDVLDRVMRGASHLMPKKQLADSLSRYEDWWLQFGAKK